MRRRVTVCVVLAGILLLGFGSTSARGRRPGEPDRVVVQHILIGFKGSVGDQEITRSRKEAMLLAAEVLERAQRGEDFDELVKKYTADSHPGIYAMCNFKVKPQGREFPRENMVPFFGDVAFGLKVGEIGMARYHAANSKYGWHIIKRLE